MIFHIKFISNSLPEKIKIPSDFSESYFLQIINYEFLRFVFSSKIVEIFGNIRDVWISNIQIRCEHLINFNQFRRNY